ncbi:MAG: hypothetical protein RL562_1240 [Planctomycetota bacterium]|jgi:uncharacterized protein YcfL
MNILRALSSVLLFAAPFLGCSGCSAPPLPADGVTSLQSEVREVFADDLRGEVEVGTPRMRRTAGNQLQVVVPLTNVARRDLQLLVQVQFLDESGAPSGDETNRQVFLLPRGGTRAFEATSRTSSARDYRLYLWSAEK